MMKPLLISKTHMFVVGKTMSMGQLLSFLLTATNFYSPQIRKNCIDNNAISPV